jgi:MFS family permease
VTTATQSPSLGVSEALGVSEVNRASGSRLAVLLLAITAFVIVTTEFVIVGMLPSLARDLGVSIATAGWLVTLFAFTVMLFGPILTGLLSHFDRKRLFVVLLLVFAGANALAAIAPNIWVLALERFLPAIALPVFWGTASETAAEIAGPERAGKAVSNVYLGISGAMVFGIPLGTLAGDAFGLARHLRGAGRAVAADGGAAAPRHADARAAAARTALAPDAHPQGPGLPGQHRPLGGRLHRDVHLLYLPGGPAGAGGPGVPGRGSDGG